MVAKEKRLKVSGGAPPYELLLFVVFFLEFLVFVPEMRFLNPFCSVYYTLSFKDFGFISRIVLGSVIRLFTDYVKTETVYAVIMVFTVSLIVIVSVLLGRVIKIVSKNTGAGAETLALFIACPVTIQYLFNIENFGRFDLQSILITVILLFCVKNEKAKWVVPFLCAFAMVLNFNFAFMFMPVAGIVMLYEYFRDGSKKRLLILILSCLAVAVLFVYLKLLAPAPDLKSLPEVKNYLAEITDIQGGEVPVFYDICYPFAKFYSGAAHNAYGWIADIAKTYGVAMLLITLPVIAALAGFWKTAIHSAEKKSNKFVFLLSLAAPVGVAPLFLAVDWHRWIHTIFISQFVLAFYFLTVNDTDVTGALVRLKERIARRPFLFLVLLIYSAGFIFSDHLDVFLSVMSKHIDSYLDFR